MNPNDQPPSEAPRPTLAGLSAYLDQLLSHATVSDWPQARNGLQVENDGTVTKLGAAVDACETTFRMALEAGVDLLLVHHGLFWSGVTPVTGAAYRKLKLAIEGNLALYSSHLPLDLHPDLGNNVGLATAIGLPDPVPFFMEKGSPIGLLSETALDRDTLRQRLEEAVGAPVKLIPGGPQTTARIGLVTGGAGGEVFKAAEEGVDTFITGEGPHWSYTAAEELGVNLLYAGHYATETFGVKALARHLSERYRLPWVFLDHPTGL